MKLIDSFIKNFLNKRLTEKPVTLTAEKKDLVIVLQFLGKLSLDLRTRFKNSISKNLPFCKIRVIFKSSTHTSRVAEHSVVSILIGKRSKSKKSTAVKDHVPFWDHKVSIDDFKILVTSESDIHVKVKESLLISRDKPILNKNETSLLLYLFD